MDEVTIAGPCRGWWLHPLCNRDVSAFVVLTLLFIVTPDPPFSHLYPLLPCTGAVDWCIFYFITLYPLSDVDPPSPVSAGCVGGTPNGASHWNGHPLPILVGDWACYMVPSHCWPDLLSYVRCVLLILSVCMWSLIWLLNHTSDIFYSWRALSCVTLQCHINGKTNPLAG